MIPQQQPGLDQEEARHYAWVTRSIEQYLDKYEPEVTGDLRKLTEARLRICIIEHGPAPSQMTPREIELAERLEKAESDNAALRPTTPRTSSFNQPRHEHPNKR